MNAGMVMNIAALAISITALIVSYNLGRRQLLSAATSNLTLVAIEFLTRENRTTEFLESEDTVLTKLSSEHPPDRGVSGLPLQIRQHVDRVALYYHSLGILAAQKAVDRDLLVSVIYYKARQAWIVLEPYILRERELRIGSYRYMSYFEHLARIAADAKPAQIHRRLGLRRFNGPASRLRQEFLAETPQLPANAQSSQETPGPNPRLPRSPAGGTLGGR